MTKEMSNAHGMTGMHKIIAMACKQMTNGTCEGAPKSEPGTLEHTFGRLYDASTTLPNSGDLERLAAKMADDEDTIGDGPAEAGMAFLGQFIDHDLTLDATTMLGKASGDVSKIENFRTPRLDLDCVYGSGPEVTPHLYDGPRLVYGRPATDGVNYNPHDLQRNRLGRALIGDPRNDENLFVSQVQGRIFIETHNRYVSETEGDNEHRYDASKEKLTCDYHKMIVEQLLPQIVAEQVLTPLIANATDAAGRHQHHLNEAANIDWEKAPDMPVEFSAAAYRFGHSMVREFYHVNHNPGRQKVRIFRKEGEPSAVDLRGFHPVDEVNNLHMQLFFGPGANRARPIDTTIPAALINLPDEVTTENKNLAFRNMERGQITFALPSGQTVADNMGFGHIPIHEKLEGDLQGNTPLWFYILAEGEENGGKLGPVGGTLVAGVLLNLMLRGKSPYFFGSEVAVG